MSTPRGMRAYFKNARKQIMDTRDVRWLPGDPLFQDLEGMINLVKGMVNRSFAGRVAYIQQVYAVSEEDAKALVELALD